MEEQVASGIAVTPERLRELSARMSASATRVNAMLSKLDAEVAPVRSEWAGAAQTQFNALWDQLQRDATGLQSVLTGMAKLTENAGAAYEAAEQSIARSFNEFRPAQAESDAMVGDTSETFVEDRVLVADSGDVRPSRAVPPLVEQPQGEMGDISEPRGKIHSLPAETAIDSDTVASHGATEIVDDVSEVTVRPAGRPLGSVRPLWARRMPKEGHESEAGKVMIDTKRDRRFKTPDPMLKPGTRLCQCCYTVVVLEPKYIETTATHTYFRCPNCENSFPIRHDDIETCL